MPNRARKGRGPRQFPPPHHGMEKELVDRAAKKMAKGKPVAQSEDMPGWKWWKQGNRTAGNAYATKNPAPKRFTLVPGDRSGTTRAVSPGRKPWR